MLFQSFHLRLQGALATACAALVLAIPVLAQSAPSQPQASAPQTQGSGQMIDQNEAIRRAQANEPVFAAALAENKALALDRTTARAALLPQVRYYNQFLYTQSNGRPNGIVQATPPGTPQQRVSSAPVFVANNGVHEYLSQGTVTETAALRELAAVRQADATAARAQAEFEIARRGLVATVVGLYITAATSQHRLAIAERAANEASSFTDLTSKREQAREVAHADVVKAQLLQQQRQRDFSDARLLAERARLELAVLLFPDPRTPFQIQLPAAPPPLPSRDAIEQSAAANNAELKSALATLQQSDADVLASRAAYLPDLSLNVTYGIDALQFAKRGPRDPSIPGDRGARNLGYSAFATLDIPIWDWLSTERRVKQSEIRRSAVRVALTAAQRRMIAAIEEGYSEAAAAHEQAASFEESVRTAAESLRLTKLRYTNGEATALEVVDAQTSFTAAENAREDGIVRYQNALANLQTLTGTL